MCLERHVQGNPLSFPAANLAHAAKQGTPSLSLSLSAGFIHTTIPKIIFGGACNCGFEQGVGPQVRRAVNFILLIKHTRI